jgi:hypothetical protein
LAEFKQEDTQLEFKNTHDAAVDRKTGDLYVASDNEVTELSPYGAFVLAFGSEVDNTKVALRKEEQAKSVPVTVTAEEEDICTAASGDSCSKTGVGGGTATGQFATASGIAVEQSTGDVFVVDGGHRVQKFNATGHFLIEFGFNVNKAKAAALASPPTATEQAAADVCVAGEECQGGTDGTAEGAFESLGTRPGLGAAKTIAIGGPEGGEHVYVGDEGRIEVFGSDGEFVEQLSLSSISTTEKVTSIAANAAGDVFFAYKAVAGIHMAETVGGKLTLSSTVFDQSSTGVEALGASAGSLYVADNNSALRMLDYEVASPSTTPAEFANRELAFEELENPVEVFSIETASVNGVAVDGAGTVNLVTRAPETYNGYLSGAGPWPTGYHSSVKLYGALAAMEASYGAPPELAPSVGTEEAHASPDEESATLEAKINPAWRTTKYQFEYGREPCESGECTKLPTSPAALGAAGKSTQQALVTLSGLEVGTPYHYRVIVENTAGVVRGSEQVFRIGRSFTPGSAVGLPDGRVYEQVSPANKYGNSVEAVASNPAFVAPSGEAVMYEGSGALAEGSANSTKLPIVVSERTSKGWLTRSAMPLPRPGATSPEEYVESKTYPEIVVPSQDLTRLVFSTENYVPYVGAPDEPQLQNNIYLAGSDPFVEPEWVGRSQIEGQPGGLENEGDKIPQQIEVAGTSPNLETIYFYYGGKLLPGGSDLYEYRHGVLSDAGALPGEEVAAGRALPAAEVNPEVGGKLKRVHATSPAGFDNQVSADGSRIFFVREDHAGQLELYVHVTATDGSQRTELISQSQLAGHEGEPAANGPYAMPSTAPATSVEASGGQAPEHGSTASPPTYVFASPDGSHAFFESTDQLTEDAPGDGSVKTYDFDLETGRLEYIAAITGSVVVVSNDGSSLLFENTTKQPFAIERWAAGPEGGTVTEIATLPSVTRNVCGAVLCIGPASMTSDGAVVAFATEAPIPGFNDGGLHLEFEPESNNGSGQPRPNAGEWPNSEIFRYDATSNELTCVSCAPEGQAPTSNAIMSKLAFEQSSYSTEQNTQYVDNPGRAMNAEGSEIFFETRDALAPQDANGTSDVYEWESGKVYLISGGREPTRSVFLGISESGNDAFFATAEGIAAGDTDGAYDVYDARVPRPGDKPVEATPCEGAVCQGPPSVPDLLGQPASEAFSGPGNLLPASKQSSPTNRATKVSKGGKGTSKKCKGKARKASKACKRTGKKHSASKRKRHKSKAPSTKRGRAVTRLDHHSGRGE